jgi:hypothetical protein
LNMPESQIPEHCPLCGSRLLQNPPEEDYV